MMMLLATLPALAAIGNWLLNMASFIVARLLNMPQPLVYATGMVVFAHVEAVETSIGRQLCPRRLQRKLRAIRHLTR